MDFPACEDLIKDFLRTRLAIMGETESGLYNYYAYLARQDHAFVHYDRPIVEFLAKQPRAKRYVDVGAGIGQLSVLLACHGMTAIAVEGDSKRALAANALLDRIRASDAEMASRLRCMHCWFPAPEVPVDRDTILMFTNVITNLADQIEQPMLEACSEAGGIVVDLVRFTRARSSATRWSDLIARFCSRGFSAPVDVYSWGHPSESEPATTDPGKIVFFQRVSQ